MNPKLLGHTIGFLAAFVLLSYAPAIPNLARGVTFPAGINQNSDILLGTAAALGLLLLVIRRRVRPRAARGPARGATAPVESVLRGELRRALDQGERIPAIARRYHLAQDAVRVAVGRGPSTPAAKAERLSRSRQRPLAVAAPAARVGFVSPNRTPYHTVG